jgi:hypothetical protein
MMTKSDSTFLRHVITGEWSEVFSADSDQILAGYVNDTLIKAGHETNPDGWSGLEQPATVNNSGGITV